MLQNQQTQYPNAGVQAADSTLNPQARQNLTQAGASNLSQQLLNTQQMLQQVMQRLHNAQSQVQVQAQGQLRELQQLEMQVAQTLQQFQTVQQAVQSQGGLLM